MIRGPGSLDGEAAVAPLRPEHTRALLASFRRAGRATLLGTVVTGAAQGALAAVGFPPASTCFCRGIWSGVSLNWPGACRGRVQ
jgi:hypothetical protein